MRSPLCKKVVLDFRFRSRRPYRDACPVRQFEDRHLFFGDLVAFNVTNRFRLEISDSRHLRSGYIGKRIDRVRFNQLRNFAGTFPLWDMLFGTFRNPRPREIFCGFTDGAERRLLDMIRGKDVTA